MATSVLLLMNSSANLKLCYVEMVLLAQSVSLRAVIANPYVPTGSLQVESVLQTIVSRKLPPANNAMAIHSVSKCAVLP
jgi:hypothetical protein